MTEVPVGAGEEPLRPFRWRDGVLYLLDQRRLPAEEIWLPCRSADEVADAIRALVVRGAPAIGIAAAYGLALAARAAAPGGDPWQALTEAATRLRATRPTAVNLAWALDRVLARARRERAAGADGPRLAAAVEEEADAIAAEDLAMNEAIGRLGAPLIRDGAGVLTYCNTGALATGGHGTALGVVRTAWRQGKRFRVYVAETRPVLQGARLTAWELTREGIPCTLCTDNAVGGLMAAGAVDLVLVGADRIAANGDVANKVGTYALAVLARHHGIPFYVAAPRSTVDLATPSGHAIPIEERPPAEVTHVAGVRLAPDGVAVWNPAFDVTPAWLITAIVTDAGVLTPPYDAALRRVATDDRAGEACGRAADGTPAPQRQRG